MSDQETFRRLIEQATREEQAKLLPPKPTFFQQRTVEEINERMSWEIDPGSLKFRFAYPATCQETARRLLPLVDFLTQTKSIAEFQKLKMELIGNIWKYDPFLRSKRGETLFDDEEVRMGWVAEWLQYLLPALRIFSRNELDNLEEKTPGEVWNIFETPSPFRQEGDKIISHEEAITLVNQIRQNNIGRVGLVVGKWRLGPSHPEHITLIQNAKQALGSDGLLIASVESQRSVQQRKGKDVYVQSDKERLVKMAALGAVDRVVLHSPSGEELNYLPVFYRKVQQELRPDLWFIGSKDNQWLEEYQKRAGKMGTILLWDRPTTTMSTTEIIEEIRKAC